MPHFLQKEEDAAKKRASIMLGGQHDRLLQKVHKFIEESFEKEINAGYSGAHHDGGRRTNMRSLEFYYAGLNNSTIPD